MLARRQVVAIRGRSPAAGARNRNARPRRPIRPARCGSSSPPAPAGRATPRRGWSRPSSRKVSASRSTSRTCRGGGGNIAMARRRARRAGRLYDPRRHQQPRHQHQPLSENPLRSLQGLRADFADVLVAACAGGASLDSGADRQRTGRAGQGKPRQIQLRLGRPRHARASRRRIVQAGARRRHHARAVQRRRSGHRLDARRARADRGVGAADRR